MELPGFVPEELRQLARFVPTTGWEAIEWRPMLAAMRNVSIQFMTGRGVRKLRRVTQETVSAVTLTDTLDDAKPLSDVRQAKQLRRLGDDILHLYFGQWLVDEGLFLDLRTARFAVRDDELLYEPNGLWIRLRPEFREGMVALYRSFYSADDKAFESALRKMGMLRPGLSKSAKTELKELLHKHFGVDQSAQVFKIDEFKASFDELFAFFIANDYKLHSDFVFVGFYLITLYLTLEQGGQPHDTRKICSEVML
jgi:predicted unusual protein kinase regulating ubiquinone biosynthesis (AarF/ABC1/UbiB family)